jgi:cell wall-associated NlpC family hydrolase
MTAPVVRLLRAGETLTVVDQTNRWWTLVRDQHDKTGYVTTRPTYVAWSPSIMPSHTPSLPASLPASLPSSQRIQALIDTAMRFIGTPYEWGSDSKTTDTFDCSDFVRTMYAQAVGIVLPRQSSAIAAYVRTFAPIHTEWASISRGDIVFFKAYGSSSNTVTHVAIALGDGRIIHTYSKESNGVRIDTIAGRSWERRMLFAATLVPADQP